MATVDEYNPYEDAHALPKSNEITSTFLPNRSVRRGASSAAHPHESDPTWAIVLTGAAVVQAIVLITMGLLVQIFGVHVYHFAESAVFTTAPLGRTLAIAHLASVAVTMSVPLVVGLGAYLLAGRWLEASRVEGIDRPTPYQ